MSVVANIGRAAAEFPGIFRGWTEYVGETAAVALSVAFRPWRFRFRDAALAFQRAACEGLAIASGIGFLLGVILAFQCAAALQMFGVEVYVSDMLVIALFRELGPVVTAIVLAGRSGSAFAAEIGTMKVNEELDALRTMGLNPIRFLVLPRLAAVTAAMPVLTIFSELAGLLGGQIVLQAMNVPSAIFWQHAVSSGTVFMIVFGLVKSAFFGMLVGLIGCGAGLRTRSTADGVGRSATSAVVGGMVAIALADGIAAAICHVWGV